MANSILDKIKDFSKINMDDILNLFTKENPSQEKLKKVLNELWDRDTYINDIEFESLFKLLNEVAKTKKDPEFIESISYMLEFPVSGMTPYKGQPNPKNDDLTWDKENHKLVFNINQSLFYINEDNYLINNNLEKYINNFYNTMDLDTFEFIESISNKGWNEHGLNFRVLLLYNYKNFLPIKKIEIEKSILNNIQIEDNQEIKLTVNKKRL